MSWFASLQKARSARGADLGFRFLTAVCAWLILVVVLSLAGELVWHSRLSLGWAAPSERPWQLLL